MEGFGCNHNVNQSVVAGGDEEKSTFLLKPPNKNLTQFLFMGPGSGPSFIFITFGGRETHFNNDSSVKAALACNLHANTWPNSLANPSL